MPSRCSGANFDLGERMPTELELSHDLAYYTLAHADPAFIHQHAVDAFAAQNAHPTDKPIGVVFGLIGLYLHLERGFTGRQVQLAHMRLGTPRRSWTMPRLPESRGTIRVGDVLAAEPGPERDAMIQKWCTAVWEAYRDVHREIAGIVWREPGVD
jgi:hypothetical protein